MGVIVMEIKEEIQGTYCNNCKCKVEQIYLLSEKMSVCLKCSSKDIEPLIKKWIAVDDHNKKIDILTNKLEKILSLIEGLKEQSDNWSKLCDCPASENPIIHDRNCMTVKIRKDIKELEL